MKSLLQRFRRLQFHREERATSLLEFTFCIAVVLTAVFGIINVCGAIFINHYVVSAARQGARYATVRGSNFSGVTCTTVTTASCAATATNVTAYVKSIAPLGLPLSNLTVATTWPGTDGSGVTCVNVVRASNTFGCLVTVKVSYAYNFTLPFLPRNVFNLTSSSTQTISE